MMKNDDVLSQDDVSSHNVRDKAVVAELIGASKKFKSGNIEIIALQRTDLKLLKGELLLIIGPSGSGKNRARQQPCAEATPDTQSAPHCHNNPVKYICYAVRPLAILHNRTII